MVLRPLPDGRKSETKKDVEVGAEVDDRGGRGCSWTMQFQVMRRTELAGYPSREDLSPNAASRPSSCWGAFFRHAGDVYVRWLPEA